MPGVFIFTAFLMTSLKMSNFFFSEVKPACVADTMHKKF